MRTLILVVAIFVVFESRAQETFAEKLGFPKGARVLILHVDDVGMSWDSNQGAINAIENGVATSLSIMMPTPWVPGFFHYMRNHPKIDAGLHLTLTSEWTDYRWHPLSGKSVTPGLVDPEGAFWAGVAQVVEHASADEVETEIRAQIERCRAMGFEPTHLDSHMGTVFAKPEFLERYVKVGISEKIPIMFPGGHNSLILRQMNLGSDQAVFFRNTGKKLWDAGLPVLDDLHTLSYEWDYTNVGESDEDLRKFATGKYIETLRETKPGLTMVIMHCTAPTEVFKHISDSGKLRKGDLLAMTDPQLREFLNKEGFILTTWREVMERRSKLK
jgi:Uncharacterized protein conserved in bacteria